MFFKRMDLHGFKSFGHKTSVEFREGFTIVVGPNGCGKSNILDAIRWVLGETSAKSLRGGRMGDVVFRGSSSMKPAGLANVTLTLDNTRGVLKTDDSEVAVTRRLFASGESGYQLNKQNCRMKDIHELFLDTGLGADGYSIIEQGQIGQMVAAKPNERRDIFEEAAGISRYKQRREETVRKLARTEDDLNRLVDLVNEVERQCNSLRHQARKAQRHRRLTRRLGRLQQRLIVLRHEIFSKQFAEAEARRKEIDEAFQKAAAAAAQAEAAIAKHQARHDELQNEQQALQQQRHELQRRLDSEKHRVELAGTRIKNIDERLATIERELQSRDSRQSVMSGTLEALELDCRNEEQSYAQSEIDLREKVEALENVRRRTEVEQREINALRNEVRELQTRQNTLANDKRVAETIIERLGDEMEAISFQHTELKEQIEQLEKRLAEGRERVDQLHKKLEDHRAEARSVQQQIGEDDRAKKELGTRLEDLTRDLGKATARLQALTDLEESYEGYFRGVKEVMKAQQRGELRGMIGVVSTLINVPSHLDVAVEVALGGDVQDIVAASVEDAKQAIGFLKRKNFGRATFLPLGFLHADFPMKHLERIWGRPGVLGLGKDLVTFDSRIEEAVRYLFGNTVFVENLDIAVQLEHEGIRNRFVSLQGDVVNPRGVLSGGSHQTRGLLSRQREIRELQEQVKKLEGELQKMREEMAATKDRLGGLYARAAELQSLIHNLEVEEAGAQKDFQQADREYREKKNTYASIEARVTQKRMDQVRQQEVVENCTNGLAELSARLETASKSLEEKEAGARDMFDQQTRMSEDVAVARQAQAGLAERVRNLRARFEELKAQMEESHGERAAREEEKLQLTEEKDMVLVERDEAEELLGDLTRELEAKTNAVNDKAGELQSHAESMRQQLNDSQRLLRERNELDNSLREMEVKTAELRANVQNVEREAEDEFALTMEELRAALAEAEEADQKWREEQEAAKEAAIVAKREAREAAKKAAAESAEGESGSDDSPETDEGEPAQPAAASDDDSEGDDDPTNEYEPATTPEDDAITEPSQLRALVAELRGKLQRMGAVNEAAIDEYAEQSKRLTFLVEQRDDVMDAKQQLENAIMEIDQTTSELFNNAYEAIRENFKKMFTTLFNGGEADLILVHDEKYPEPGIDIFAQPPGKKIGGSITLMSGGEKALTAIALMFSLFQYRPSPICILDEIDAPLDDENVRRLCDALKRFASDTQFLIITHNKITMGLADTIYGVTMQEPGVSKLVSVKFEEVEEQGLLDEVGAG